MKETKISNPILPGFNPDPSILCIGEDFYIATSTFEWYPGVRIYHSNDLVNWDLTATPLNSLDMLDMRGTAFSTGIWAPCLSYDSGTFYLIFTNVKSDHVEPFKDTPNYITTAKNIEGPWSIPTYLNSSGFDPSLFHDNDGRKWLVNMEWDFTKEGKERFAGILLQEYDQEQNELIGQIYKISFGTEIGITEGPHLYKRNGYYYLMLAEGGTSYQHAVTVLRSKDITGPYEKHPNTILLSSYEEYSIVREDICENNKRIQKAGHGSICETSDGKWFLAHLGARPFAGTPFCVLGRETCLQEIEWHDDDWCYLKEGGTRPKDTISVKAKVVYKKPLSKVYNFDTMDFMKDFQTLRIPADSEYYSISKRKGYLRVTGRESIFSTYAQSLLARRQTNFSFNASVSMEFEPFSYRHMAGMIYRYNEWNQYYVYLTYNEERRCRRVELVMVRNGKYKVLDKVDIADSPIDNSMTFHIEVREDKGQFYFQDTKTKKFRKIGRKISTLILSDEYAKPMGFTGAFIGFCVQDLNNQKKYADFKSFVYEGVED